MENQVKIQPNFTHHGAAHGTAGEILRTQGSTRGAPTDARARVAEGIRKIRTCMLTTVTPEGRLESTPMTTQEIDSEDNIWFFVGTDADSTMDIDREENVNLSYAAPKESEYISITGSAKVVIDRAKAEKLWSPSYVTWFPKGLNDPNLALLKVKILNAEYWETAASRPLRLFGLVRALFTAEPFEVGIDHQKVKLN